jgi:hypothetical protein
MYRSRVALAALLAAGLGSTAMAQEQAVPATTETPAAPTITLDDLDADRINANQVTIDFEYDGSACEQVGTAELGEVANGTLAVTFPTVATAEICTQQIVEIEVEQTIEAGADVTRVDVTLTRPDGTVLATGSDNVDND